MSKAGNRDHATPWTKHAPKGSLADRLNEDTGLKGSIGVTGTGAVRTLESPATANLKDPHPKQGANKSFSTGGPRRS